MFGKRQGRSYYASLLAQRASERMKRKYSADEVIATVSLGDPTEDLIYLDWMLKFIYEIGGGIGDTNTISKFLALYDEIKHLLSGKRRELGDIHSLEDFAAMLSPHFRGEADLYGGMIGRYRRAALDESELIYEDQDYLVVCPRTKSAGVFWCTGTNWMIDVFTLRAMDLLGRLESPGRFLDTLSLGAISKRSGEKITANISKSYCRDSRGNKASFWQFIDKPSVMHVLGPWLLRQSLEFASTMPIQFMTREVASIFVSGRDRVIGHLPKDVLDRDLYIQAILKDWRNIDHVPDHMLDRDLYAVYIAQEGAPLKNVPVEFRDRETCLRAIRSHSGNLKYVPKEFLDTEFRSEALQVNPYVLSEFPQKMITKELCLKSIEGGGVVIAKAFDAFLDREICERSVERKPYLIRSVPERFLDRALIRIAISRWGGALQHVKRELQDRALCVEAVNQNPVAIAYVPREILDRKLLLSALERDGTVLSKLPSDLKDEEVCRVAMRSNLEAARHVPRNILRNIAAEFEPEYAKRAALTGPRASIWDSYIPQLAELRAALAIV